MYKRKCDGGILCNLTLGGEGAYGRILSEESKNKISKKVSGINHGMYGKSHTEAAKNKIVEAASKSVINTETNEIFTSIKNAAISINIRPNTLTRKLSGIRHNDTVFKLI
jgi:alpha-galactosidase/6-phospho-beta-glucosidase family protein